MERLNRRWLGGGRLSGLSPVWSVPAAMRAVRAAIVMPTMFLIADKVIGNPQVALFAAFGSFATLVLVSFAGDRRDKLIAHLGLALAGSVLLTIGTAVSFSTLLAALVTIPVAFTVFFAGVAGPNAASGVIGALLVYVLPAASPGTISMIPDRLAGWWLASVAGTIAVLVFSPPAPGSRLRGAAAKLARVLADEIDAMLAGDVTEARWATCIEAKQQLLAAFTATPFRPTGLATSDQALGNSVELLEWCTALLGDSLREREDVREGADVDRQLLEISAAVLRDAGSLFAGTSARQPDLERLEEIRRQSIHRLHHVDPESEAFRPEAQLAFHAHAIAVTALAIGADALATARLIEPEWMVEARNRWFGESEQRLGDDTRRGNLTKYAHVAFNHASVRSVWFINSMRGALALAAAVAIADLSNVQHGFWVVLGTLSVLRTNAASTGSIALRALIGTIIGFAVGAALLLAIGSTTTALWVALPIAVLIAAYAPGTAPFAVGQAAFTITVAVLFNLIHPVGWKVGEVRVEDVAIGCAVSLIVGIVFWPRGVSSVVGDDLADAYRSGAAYLSRAVQWAAGLGSGEPVGASAAVRAGLRLDDALRGFLAEQGTKHIAKEELWRLVGGSLRLRLTAHAVAGMPRRGGEAVGPARAELAWQSEVLRDFYDRLADQMGRPKGPPAPAPEVPEFDGDGVKRGARSREAIWLSEHLDHLAEHLAELVPPALHVAEFRRRPWWR